MATRYQDISYGQFGGGIDALSPESKIPDGFVEYLRNVDPTPEGSLEKRRGYQLYGSVPTRVERITYSQDETQVGKGQLCFYLDESVNVLNLKSSPIVAYGKTSECHQAGDWSDTNSYNYYPWFTVDVRRTILPNTTSVEVLQGSVHKQGSDLEVIVVQATTATTTSNLQLIDNVEVDVATGDVEATLSNFQSSNLNIFLLAKSREAQAGSCYIQNSVIPDGTTQTITIDATIHNLNSFNINTSVYRVANGKYELITPDQVKILATGAVQFTLTNNTGSSQTYRLMLYSPEDALSTQWLVPADFQLVKTIPVTGDFPLFQLYTYNNDGSRSRIWPDKIEIDSINKLASITINNLGNPGTLDIRAYWDYAPLVSNRIVVEAADPSASTTIIEVPSSEHLLGKYLSIQASESLNTLAADNRQLLSDLSRVVLANNNVEVALTNNLATSFQAWIALKQRPAVAGSCYHYTTSVNTGVQTLTIPAATHNLATTRLGIDLYQVTGDYYTRFKEDGIVISNGGDVTITLTNTTGSNFDLLAYVFKTDAVEIQTGYALPETISVITATMGESLFPFFNCYSLHTVPSTGVVTRTRVYPQNISMNSTNNLAYLSFTNNDNNLFGAVLNKSASTITWTNHGLVAGQPVKFESVTGITNITAGTTYYVSATSLANNSFRISTSSGGSALSFLGVDGTATAFAALNLSINWDYADAVMGSYCVSPAVSSADGYTDDKVQLSIWGLPHSNLYGGAPSGTAPGWVTHVDTYRAQSEERAVCGLGGNLFAAYTGSELDLPIYYPNLRNRVESETIIAPVFYGTSDSPTRTNGWIKFDGGETKQVRVTQVVYNPSTSWVDYTLYTPNWVASSTNLSSIITDKDYLTATNMGYPVHAGEFLIRSVQAVDYDHIVVSVYNPDVSISDWNDTDSGGVAGIYTDSIPLETQCQFIEDDRILSIDWGEEQFIQATDQSSGTTLRVKGLYEAVTIADGLLLTGRRSSYIMPIRELNATRTTYQLVPGDVLGYNDLDREIRVVSVNAMPDMLVSISAASGIATVTIPNTYNNKWLVAGQRILLVNAGQFTGVQTISAVSTLSKYEFYFETSLTGSVGAATLQGYYVELDENLDWADTTDNLYAVDVARRWMPVENPATGYPLVTENKFRYFTSNSYDSQPMLRSCMVNDTLYLTNGDDAVQRFDGSSITRAGLIRWQTGLFITKDTTASSKLTFVNISLPTADILSVTDNVLKVTDGKEKLFTDGTRVVLETKDGSGNILNTYYCTTANIHAHGSPSYGYITLTTNDTIALAATNTLYVVNTYRYYFRLNLLDANNNRIITGVTNAEDYVIELYKSSAVHFTFLRPSWIDNYDYQRIELQVYRTKAESSTNYYRVTTLKPYWSNSPQAYIQYTDSTSDDALFELDATITALTGIGLGQTWTGPLRAKYVTSGSNRLVLGNIKSWPSLSLTMADRGDSITKASLAGLRWLLRKSNTDSGTSTDNINRMGFEFLTNTAISFNPVTAFAIDAETGLVTWTDGTHGLTAKGDWFYLFHSTIADGHLTRLGGWYQVEEIISTTKFSFYIDPVLATEIGSAALATDVDRLVHATDPSDVPVWLETDGLYTMVNAQIGTLIGAKTVTMRRLASAINAAQNICSSSGFKPWVVAYAGGEYPAGQIILETPYVSGDTLEVLLPNFRLFNIFANGILATAKQQVQAVSQRFPSRLIMSYRNYPELFDNPTAYSDVDSESAIDINSADGQEITGVIPFFGEAAFGAAQKDAILLVFKTASVYLVNLAEKAAGRNAVQKLDTRGLGCTAPYSIAPTQNGIMFANQSGIYRITTGLEMQYIGRRMERLWQTEVDTKDVANTYGHYSALENRYKLAVPVREDTQKYPTQIYVYNTVREYTADGYRDGSWTTYDNMTPVGWVNLLNRSLFASPHGEVFTIRNAGDATDYRDDGAPIVAEATLRALDFGSSGIRKTVATFILQFRTAIAPEQVTVESAINLLDQWEALDPATIKGRRQDSLSSIDTPKVSVIRFTSNRRKGVFFQLRVKNENYDEGLDLLGGSVLVAALGPQGTVEAADT